MGDNCPRCGVWCNGWLACSNICEFDKLPAINAVTPKEKAHPLYRHVFNHEGIDIGGSG